MTGVFYLIYKISENTESVSGQIVDSKGFHIQHAHHMSAGKNNLVVKYWSYHSDKSELIDANWWFAFI